MTKPPRQTSTPIEITLPSGIFARIRPVKFVDSLIAGARAASVERELTDAGDDRAGVPMWAAAIMARCVLFDDETYTIHQVLELDARDTGAICQALLPYMQGPIR